MDDHPFRDRPMEDRLDDQPRPSLADVRLASGELADRPVVDHGPRPEGRWHRILNAVKDGPISTGLTFSLIRDLKHTRRRDKAKFYRAINALFDLGLITIAHGRVGPTDAGQVVLRDLDEAVRQDSPFS